MSPRILGLHHVTATVDAAQADLDFCRGALGLRLVKKTVNFDNHHVFHFYYGNEQGAPGTIWTTFPYAGQGVRRGAHGTGQIGVTAFSAPPDAIDAWRDRLPLDAMTGGADAKRFGAPFVRVTDPSGLVFEVIAADDERTPWTGGPVAAPEAIRGLDSVTMTVREAEPSIAFMRRALGYEIADREGHRTRMVVNGGGAGRTIDVVADPHAPAGLNGLGTVHHVAMAIGTSDEQLALREELIGHGARVTDVRDRCYFTSIYFREPGGVLFEVATVDPGFTIDEPLAELGQGLKLPSWEEANRADIEAHLPRIVS